MSTLATFHLFPQLPSELRLKVYDFALSTPRTVVVSCKREKIEGTREFAETFTSQNPVPALLHTCRESRIEGLKVYKPAFRTDTSPNYTYAAFDQDTIECIDRVVQYLKRDEIDRVQKMLVRVYDSALFWHFHMETVMAMQNLEELDILASQEQIGWGIDRRWVDGLTNDIRLTKENVPDWCCPRIRVLDNSSSEEIDVIPYGVWVEPEEDGQTSGERPA
jgi:hypothetical protein